MSSDHEAEIRASVGAYHDLGSGYDDAVAEGLVERIGAEIDKRIDARLGQFGPRYGSPVAAGAPALPPGPAVAPGPATPPGPAGPLRPAAPPGAAAAPGSAAPGDPGYQAPAGYPGYKGDQGYQGY